MKATALDDEAVGPPKGMAPGLGTVGGAPTDADSQAKPADAPPVVQPLAQTPPPPPPPPLSQQPTGQVTGNPTGTAAQPWGPPQPAAAPPTPTPTPAPTAKPDPDIEVVRPGKPVEAKGTTKEEDSDIEVIRPGKPKAKEDPDIEIVAPANLEDLPTADLVKKIGDVNVPVEKLASALLNKVPVGTSLLKSMGNPLDPFAGEALQAGSQPELPPGMPGTLPEIVSWIMDQRVAQLKKQTQIALTRAQIRQGQPAGSEQGQPEPSISPPPPPNLPPQTGPQQQPPPATLQGQPQAQQPPVTPPGTFSNPATGNIEPLQTQSPQPQPMPSGTGAGAPQGAPFPTDPHDQIAALVASGLSSGAAQAIINGQTPKTISGDKPAPPQQPKAAPEQNFQVYSPKIVPEDDTTPAAPSKPTIQQPAQQPAPQPEVKPTQPQPESMESAEARYEAERAKLGAQQPSSQQPSSQQPQQSSPTESRVVEGVNLKGVDPRIEEIIGAAAQALPLGYTVKATSGLRSAGQGQHTLGKAADWQIIGPDGKPVNNRGDDTTGLYTLLAKNAYGYQEKYHPELTGQFQWGGQFGTSASNSEEPDLMHFDIGGRRGHITRYSRENIGAALPPVQAAVTTADDVSTALQLNKSLGGLLKDKGSVYVAMGKKYGVDPRLLAAISMNETGNGTSHLLRTRNNVGGITGPGHTGAGGDYQPYNSIDEGIEAEASLIRHGYLNQGYDTIGKIGGKWAPPGAFNDPNKGNANWPTAVAHFYAVLGGTGKLGETGGEYPSFGGSTAKSGSENPFAGQPLFSIGSGGGGGSAHGQSLTPPFSEGGDSGRSSPITAQPEASVIAFKGDEGSRSRGTAAAEEAQPQVPRQSMQVSAPLPDDQQNPMVQALINRGFTPQQAQQFALSSQNIAPGKGVGPLTAKGPPPPAPSPSIQLKLVSPKQLMPGKAPKIVPTKAPPPAAPGAQGAQGKQLQLPAPPAPSAPAQSKAPVTTPQQQAPARQPAQAQAPPPAPPPPKDQPKPKAQPVQAQPTEFRGRPAGSTHGDPNPPGIEGLQGSLNEQGKQHKALLSADDPRVSKQKDNYIKGEHFVEGDPYNDQLLNGLPHGKQGRQRGILGQGETAIADKSPMHISYISAPQEAEKFPTRESRKVQYDAHSPEARLMGTTEGQLVGHSMIPLSVGVKLPDKKDLKAGNPAHQGYIQGLSTNILANNFQHVNDKLEAMGRKTPYKQLGTKFSNDLEGYFHNLLAGHTATGSGYTIGTEDHPNEPDRSHVPYMLTRKEADFIGTVINNDAAFSQHEDAKKIRELARANGTLITEKGETNRLQHDIEQHEPGWRKRVLEHAVKTFRSGLIHEIHPTEEHMPESIRPGKSYQQLTKALARTSERGRPDIAVGASLHHTFQDNAKINKIERDFSEHRIDEAEARNRIKALGEDPEDYRFIGGSGGLITPYEDDPEAITPEEHSQMKDNLRQQWVGGKLGVDDYRKKAAEVPLPSKPSKPKAAQPVEAPEAPPVPKPKAPVPPKPPKPKAPPSPEPEEKAATEKLYRGMATGGQGHYYSPDKEWARQFTQSGQDHEIQERHVKSDDIHEPDEPVEANDVEGVDKAISDAKTAGKKAVRLSEGKDQPDSVHVFDKSALIHPSKVAAIAKPKEAAPPAVAPSPDEPLPEKAPAQQIEPSRVQNSYAKSGDKVHWLPTDEVDKRWQQRDKDLHIPPGGTKNTIGKRYEGAKEYLQSDQPVNAPRAHVDEQGGISFIDGRHRFAAMRDMGHEKVPVALTDDAHENAAKTGLTESAVPPKKAPAPDEPLPPVAKTAAPKKVVAPQEEKEKTYKEMSSKEKEDYVSGRVKDRLANQIKGAVKLRPVMEGGKYKRDDAGNPQWEKDSYDLVNSPLLGKKRLDAMAGKDPKLQFKDQEDIYAKDEHTHLNPTDRRRLSHLEQKSAVDTMADKIVEHYQKHMVNEPSVMAAKGWYTTMQQKLKNAFGPDAEIFAQLLGATSARTGVHQNFIQSLDAYDQLKNGNFKNHIEKYLEAHDHLAKGEGALAKHMRDSGIIDQMRANGTLRVDKKTGQMVEPKTDAAAMADWIEHHNILPRQKNGQKFNANSNQVLKVLAQKWLQSVKAPKTPNFAGNLSGRTREATIDVWAARFLHELGNEGNKKPWMLQPGGESGVRGLDFAYSQRAFRKAADKLGIEPDDLQAISWYYQKHLWDQRGHTKGQGAKKASFDETFDKIFRPSGERMSDEEARQAFAGEKDEPEEEEEEAA